MNAVDIIAKKRDGQALTENEIRWFLTSYTRDEVPDYQAAALLMAIYIQGMNREETVLMTQIMADSGEQMDLSDILDYAVDKHSSGGVGDKTSLVVLPLVAASGVPVAKMSGRGLGFSGGTLDKLESLTGYNVQLDENTFRTLAQQNGLVLAGQSKDLAPADGLLYALRDVTATVASLPLIASSIMSKKLAAGANGIVLDVKAGRGAFMPDEDAARELAQIMVNIGVDSGRDMVAVISDMNQPLGETVGNALEMREAIETLQGGGGADFREHCLEIGGYMLYLAGRGKQWTSIAEGRDAIETQLSNGNGLDRFRQMIAAQDGDTSAIDNTELLPSASLTEPVLADQDGYVAAVPAEVVGMQSVHLGAGRKTKSDTIDLAVGIEVHVNVGDRVQHGDKLFTIHANDALKLEDAKAELQGCVTYSDELVPPLPLFYGVIEGIVRE